MIVVARPPSGGVSHVGSRVCAQLRLNGHTVTDVAVTDSGRGALTAWRMRRQLASAKAVHVEMGAGSIGTFWFAVVVAFLRAPLVIVAHDGPFLVKFPGAGLIRRAPGWRDRVAYRVLSPMVDPWARRMVRKGTKSWVVLSEPAARELSAAGMSPVFVVDHGSDASAIGPPPSTGKYVLFAGFLAPGKGLEILLEAWEEVGPKSNIPLRIVGGANPQHRVWAAALESASQEMPAPPEWLGALNDEEFDRAIAEAAVLVMPYTKSNPVSGILVRSLVLGRAIVASRVPATVDSVVDGVEGLLVKPSDARALAAGLLRLLLEPALRDSLGAAAAQRGARHTWPRHVEGLMLAYGISADQRASATSP
jgi:glycosyltransferase involved in cell wall biosynthesis